MEIIDQLCGGDLPLCIVGDVFNHDLKRAKRALTIYFQKGVLLVTRAPNRPDTALPIWELRSELSEECNWQPRQEGAPTFWVHLTEKGASAFNDGPGAWEAL